jgi:predicted transcriptional regulator
MGVFTIRLSDEERTAIDQAADQTGTHVTPRARDALLAAASRRPKTQFSIVLWELCSTANRRVIGRRNLRTARGFAMKLALVEVTHSDFEQIYDHLASHKPHYRNMHMREACQRKRKRELRYLHAMYALPTGREIDGMISGPGIFWHYKLIGTGARTRIRVFGERGSPKDLARIGRHFVKRILARIELEREDAKRHPKRKAGQFYLRRCQPGMPDTHRNCRRAVTSGALDPRFVSQLESWDLELLCP